MKRRVSTTKSVLYLVVGRPMYVLSSYRIYAKVHESANYFTVLSFRSDPIIGNALHFDRLP